MSRGAGPSLNLIRPGRPDGRLSGEMVGTHKGQWALLNVAAEPGHDYKWIVGRGRRGGGRLLDVKMKGYRPVTIDDPEAAHFQEHGLLDYGNGKQDSFLRVGDLVLVKATQDKALANQERKLAAARASFEGLQPKHDPYLNESNEESYYSSTYGRPIRFAPTNENAGGWEKL